MLMNTEEGEEEPNEASERTQMESPDDILDSVDAGTQGSRGSIFFDIQKKRLTYSPIAKVFRNTIQLSNKSQTKPQAKKISSQYIESLTPDKLSELKYIFQICDPQNIGEFSFSEVEKCKKARIFCVTSHNIKCWMI